MESVRVALVTRRPLVRSLFAALDRGHAPRIGLAGTCDPAEVERERFAAIFSSATVAVVDTHPDVEAILGVCEAIHGRLSTLRIAALLCCGAAASPSDLAPLAASGVTSLLDWETDADRMAVQLGRPPRPGFDLRARLTKLARAAATPAMAFVAALSPLDRQIAVLVARGHSNKEIGRAVHLTHHAIDHHVKRLCLAANVANRVELAAWAGLHGIYTGPTSPESVVV